MATLSMAPWLSSGGIRTATPSASMVLLPGSRMCKPVMSFGASKSVVTARPAMLHCSFVAPSSSLSSSFAGSSLGLDFGSGTGLNSGGRYQRLVVRAGKAALCLTKRNRSRKSLARTHGFRLRMSTTRGRAVLKRRRAKGRKVLCPKTNHNNGKKAVVY